MSAQIVGNGNGVTSFPFNNTNENNQWPALSIIGVVVTVLGFIVVVWFIFLTFRREKALRGKAAAERDTLESSTGELQLARPVIQRQKRLIRLTQALVSKNRILYRCSTDTARRVGEQEGFRELGEVKGIIYRKGGFKLRLRIGTTVFVT
jgi:hypothetical protein